LIRHVGGALRAVADAVSARQPLQRPAPSGARSGQRGSHASPTQELVVDNSQAANGPGQHGILIAISNEMVRIYKDQFGRGPTKTRTQWAGPDLLVVTLEDTFTPAEHSLRRLGEHGRLRDLRMLFQYA
jgi:hypothetical protein